jgi:hypothetical protein
MHLIYIDDSADEKLSVYSALAIPTTDWRAAFQQIREYRRTLRQAYGIYVYKELHAWRFVSGRGKISDRVIFRHQRVAIFNEMLDLMTKLPGARLFNSVFPKQEWETGFEWLVNRINRTLQAWGSQGILICDEGHEVAITRMIRRMMVFNPIPSQYGVWRGTGRTWQNLPLDRLVEDPFFKTSDQSYFIQLADFAAYALLRRENPIPSKTHYGLDQSFNRLSPILVREARPRDPDGIIRP